jgi:hypothetical protein
MTYSTSSHGRHRATTDVTYVLSEWLLRTGKYIILYMYILVMVIYVFHRFRREVIFHFLDISGIVGHHCLSFHFITNLWFDTTIYRHFLDKYESFTMKKFKNQRVRQHEIAIVRGMSLLYYCILNYDSLMFWSSWYMRQAIFNITRC